MALSELLGKPQTIPGGVTPLGAKEFPVVPKDEFAGFEPADEFAGFEAAPDEFSGFKPADDLDLREVEDLDKDREKFDPKAYFSQNPDVAKDPAKLRKLIEVYKRRRKEGLKAGEVAKAVATETPGLITGIAKGARDLAARTLDVTVQPVVNLTLGALTGELSDANRRKAFKEEGRKSIKKAFGEIGAGSEAAAAGIADIGRQGLRKIAGVPDDEQELLRQLSDDVEFQKQAATILKGGGEAAKAVGLDADTLQREGITLDEKAIEHLSLVDPVTLVATGGVFKVVGLGGKVLGTAATRAGANKLVTKLGTLAQQTVGKTVKGVGSAVEKSAQVGKSIAERIPAKSIGAVIGGGQTGTLTGVSVGAAAGEATKQIAVQASEALARKGTTVKQFGQQLLGEVPKSAGLQRVQSLIDNPITRGAAKGATAGVVGAAPLAAAVDDDKAAGALLGAGIVLGTGGGALIGAKQAIASKISKSQFDRNAAPVPNVDSPGYGLDANLDTAHEANVKTLSQNEQANINTFREALRDAGGEIYSLDPENFKQRVLENMERAKGAPLDANELAAGDRFSKTSAFFDASVPDAQGNVRRVVFLNGDSTGLLHDSGHLFQSILSPERQTELRNSVTEFYTPEEIAQFKSTYESKLGEKVTNDYILDEIIAENFNALFNNVPLTEMTAPKGFLQKLGQQSLEVAEALGIDLKAGAVTPDLQATPSYRLRSMLEAGARDVLQHGQAAKGTGPRVTPAELLPEGPRPLIPGEVELTPRETAPAAPVPAPEALKPTAAIPTVAPAPTARNIRAPRAQQNDFAAKRAEETGIAPAKAAAEKNTNPNVMAQVEAISGHMEAGNPVLEIEHAGAKAAGTEAAPSGRTARRTEQEVAYIAEGMDAAPETIRETYQKTMVPVRWEVRGSEPQLIAMSLDKVIANVHRAVKDAVSVKQGDLIPYEQADGKLTETGWKQAVADIQAYAENQANGFKGDGSPLTRPTADTGISVPAENPDFRPNILTEERANFANLVMGLAPPRTARVTGKATPGNIKGQQLAELNKRMPETPAKIAPGDLTKQEFKGFPGRSVKETNPLRNKLADAGAPIRELIEVTERINAGDVQTVKPRPDIQFRAPVTDIIRAGFLPGKETADAVRAGFLPDTKPSEPTPSPDIRALATSYTKSAGVPYKPARVYSTVDPVLAKKIADFYEGAQSNPTDPAVQASYKALADETMAQYKAITDAGYTIEPFTGKGEPYKNSAEAVSDIRDNKHLYFLQTDKVFGTGAEPSANPMLADSNVPGLKVNDVFRAVHDFFGHGKEGYQFGPRGEFNAWRAHSEMFSDAAQPALAAETLAQNSWVNFGKHLRDAQGNIALKGEKGYVEPASRPFGEQKNVLIPEELISEARAAANTAKFLPSEKPIAELGPEIARMSPDEWRKFTESQGGSLTKDAYKLGLELKDRADLDLLKTFQEGETKAGKESLQKYIEGDESAMTEAGLHGAKGQFFREVIEAATDRGSAANPKGGWRRFFPESKPPFVGTDMNLKFLPKTEKGRAAAEKGFDFQITGSNAIRGVTILKDGIAVGEIQSARRSPGMAEIANVQLSKKNRGSGAAEAAYRELLTQLKEDGVTEITGHVVAPQPLALRKKVFGERNKVTDALDTEVPIDEAISRINEGEIGFAVTSKITPEMQFLPKKRKETITEKIARDVEETDFSKYNLPKDAPKAGPATGWILPNQEFVSLDAAYHEQFLSENSTELNKKFGTDFGGTADVVERLDALNKGFVRVRYTPNNGGINIELAASHWTPKVKKKVLDLLDEQSDKIDNLRVSLLDERGATADTVGGNVAELEGAEKFNALSEAVGTLRGSAKFLPAEEGTLPGLKLPDAQKIQQDRVKARVTKAKDKFPEAQPPQYAKDEDGKFIMDETGKPKAIVSEYRFAETPVAREAVKGIRGEQERNDAVVTAIGDKLIKAARAAEKNPDIAAGAKWYSTARTRLKKLLGDDSKFFAELLGATSARTPVETNFRFALDAYNQFKQGKYDAMLKKYREGKSRWESGEISDYVKATKNADPTRASFLDWWEAQHDLVPKQSNGKKFAMNSHAVLKVLDGSWAEEVTGPKTPNFAGNLSGETFEATIDVWASRLLHRLANEGNPKPWRILPENETGLSDSDFALGQEIFRAAADKLGMKPDALQAILWFAEKDHWEKNGWTRGAGAEKSDFNVLLKETEQTEAGELRKKTPQKELDFTAKGSKFLPMKRKPEVVIERIEDEPGISGHRVVAADRTSVYKTLPYFSYSDAKAYAENTNLKVVKAAARDIKPKKK